MNKNKQKGFTLVEVLITMGILVLIIVPLSMMQVNIFSYNRDLQNILITQDQVRNTLQIITSEIRSMGPSSTGAYPIAEAENNALTFYRDADRDGLMEKIRYFLVDDELKKGVTIPTGNPMQYLNTDEKIITVAKNVRNGSNIFSYYDSGYNGSTAALGQPVDTTVIRLIKVELSVGAANQSSEQVVFATQVSLRNLKDNL